MGRLVSGTGRGFPKKLFWNVLAVALAVLMAIGLIEFLRGNLPW